MALLVISHIVGRVDVTDPGGKKAARRILSPCQSPATPVLCNDSRAGGTVICRCCWPVEFLWIVSCGMGIKQTCQITCPRQNAEVQLRCNRLWSMCMDYKANCRCE